MFLLYLSVFLTIICLTYYYCIRTFNHWKVRNVKGPKPIPFFGNYKNVALRKEHAGVFYSNLYKQYPEEKVVGIYRMTSPTLFIRDLDLVKQVLIKDFELFPERGVRFSQRGLGDNIFHCDYKVWQALRNKFTSMYTTSKLKNLFHILDKHGDKFIDYMVDVTAKQPEQDVYQQLLKYTIGTAMATEFGLEIDLINDTSQLFNKIDDSLISNRGPELEMLIPGSLVKCKLSIIPQKTIDFCHNLIQTGINNVVAKANPTNLPDALLNMKKENTMFTQQADVGKNQPEIEITEELMAAQTWIFYVAGYANNTLVLTFAMYNLARNPDVQNKLIKEIDRVMEIHENKFSYEALKEMKYVDMIFDEVLRMHPPTNGISRGAAKDVKIEGLDFTIRKGTNLIISPYAIHHDEKYYPEPEKFDPERFLPENSKARHPCSFLTFGAGRRSCLGSQMARLQFAVGLVKIFSRFRVQTTENTINNIEYNPWRLLMSSQERIKLKLVYRSK